jgi:hypothetical protein
MVWKLIRITCTVYIISYVSQRLFTNLVVRRHVRIVFFAELTNSNVLGKLPIRDSEKWGKLKIAIAGFGKNTIHT